MISGIMVRVNCPASRHGNYVYADLSGVGDGEDLFDAIANAADEASKIYAESGEANGMRAVNEITITVEFEENTFVYSVDVKCEYDDADPEDSEHRALQMAMYAVAKLWEEYSG